MGTEGQGTPTIADPDEDSLGPAMRALTMTQRRFALAAVLHPLAKDWQIAKAAGYSDRSHGSLRVKAHQQFHNDKVLAAISELAVKEVRSTQLLGIAVMRKIARRDDHKDQFKAAAHLAGLSGHTVEQKISVSQTITDRTGAEMLERIRQLAAANGLDPVKLLGGNAGEVVDAEFSEVKDG
jgi:hypothetical protein